MGHGGNGGWTQTSGGGLTYGSVTEPVTLGSGGGRDVNSGYDGGKGGGAIRLIVGGELRVDGGLRSDGVDCSGLDAGGGAGGSIWVTAGSVTGAGAISASGGKTLRNGGGGGGGRVALYADAYLFSGTLKACGGQGSVYGGAGSIYTKVTGQPLGDLTYGNCGVTATRASTELAGPLDLAANVLVTGGAVVTPTVSGTMHLEVPGAVRSETTGVISASWYGYASSTGPGEGGDQIDGGGGGHGGNGGWTQTSGGGLTYGSVTEPVTLGSGGGRDVNSGYDGGKGGGAIHLIVGGELRVDGGFRSDGVDCSGLDAGGGAGGSIWVTAGSVTGAGAISASGGKTLRNGGGGGGGRVALYADAYLFSGTLKACGARFGLAAPAASTPRSPDNRSVT
ncbi:MAG: hypothetical protein IPK72_11445 [Candidatus Eisenbacteria bacterium]|nr:hypothetical protein [Candidatus Eisenbacteria bacterium]